MAAPSASGSVIFLRIHDTHHVSLVSALRTSRSTMVQIVEPVLRSRAVPFVEMDDEGAARCFGSGFGKSMKPLVLEQTIPRQSFFYELQRPIDAGVWNGHA